MVFLGVIDDFLVRKPLFDHVIFHQIRFQAVGDKFLQVFPHNARQITVDIENRFLPFAIKRGIDVLLDDMEQDYLGVTGAGNFRRGIQGGTRRNRKINRHQNPADGEISKRAMNRKHRDGRHAHHPFGHASL